MQRIYVERPVLDAFVAAFVPKVEALKVGDPADDDTDVGPVIDADARERIVAWIAEARHGRRSSRAASTDGLIRPTVIANVADEQKVSCEEVFGPVVVVNPIDSVDEAIERANGTRYGLQAGVFTAVARHRAARGRTARLRRRHRQRGADVPQRPDAVRRREGQRQHAEGPAYAVREMTEERLVVIQR